MGLSVEETRAYKRKWAKDHKSHLSATHIAYMKDYYPKHRDRLNSLKREWYSVNVEEARRKARIARWKAKGIDITYERYQELLTKQSYSCAICKRHESELKKALAVDHNHATGKVRALLCLECNWFIVRVLEKYGNLIPAAMRYLETN